MSQLLLLIIRLPPEPISLFSGETEDSVGRPLEEAKLFLCIGSILGDKGGESDESRDVEAGRDEMRCIGWGEEREVCAYSSKSCRFFSRDTRALL